MTGYIERALHLATVGCLPPLQEIVSKSSLAIAAIGGRSARFMVRCINLIFCRCSYLLKIDALILANLVYSVVVKCRDATGKMDADADCVLAEVLVARV